MSRLEELQKRLSDVENEKHAIEAEIRSILSTASEQVNPVGTIISNSIPKTPEEKILLFMKLFACRTDVFPHRWENTNTSGYSPVCKNEWKRPLCRKPEVKCSACTNKDFIPLSADIVRDHLEGRSTIGTYAIQEDDTCIFLAADFDKSEWMKDVHAYKEAARKIGVDAAIERSRSGNGAHAWIFFSQPVKAFDARLLGTILLSNASYLRHEIELDSYDRFFPSQDTIPKGSFGNLIALPLQKVPRKSGNSEFIDETGTSYADQWQYLSQRYAMNASELAAIIAKHTEPPLLGRQYPFETEDVLVSEHGISIPPKPLEGILSGTVSLVVEADIRIDTRNLPSRAVTAMKRLATFANPKFFELERMRFPTYNTPRYISCARIDGATLSLPRGLLEDLIRLLRDAGADVSVDERRMTATPIDVVCTATLTEQQRSAVQSVLASDEGVLVAPTGSGKTIMGIAIIAARKQPTLILVNRKELAEQWRDRIIEYTNVPKTDIGMIGAGRKKAHGIIDIAMMQTLSRQGSLADMSCNYGQIIIDEAHHIPAFSFEQVLNKFSARYVLGLTATPYRKDGHQKIMYMQCGPIRHEMKTDARSTVIRLLVARPVNVLEHVESYGRSYQDIVTELTESQERNLFIVSDIMQALKEQRFPLVISERKDHLLLLENELLKNIPEGVCIFHLSGDMGTKGRRIVKQNIDNAIKGNKKFCLLSTGSLIGEGFDLSILDTLFITTPISFKGKVIQYAGRLHREHDGKINAVVYDYVDLDSGLTVSMFKKRLVAYKRMNYSAGSAGNEKLNRMLERAGENFFKVTALPFPFSEGKGAGG